jgi:hypothetical protein
VRIPVIASVLLRFLGTEMTKSVGSSPITLLESRIAECLCSPVGEVVELLVRDDPLGRKVVRDPVQGGLRRLTCDGKLKSSGHGMPSLSFRCSVS